MSTGTVQDELAGTASDDRRRGRRSGRGKDGILAAAVGVVAERGADGTRFVDASRASGVPVSTLQYYFGNREDLLVATFRYECARGLAAMAAAVGAVDDPWEQMVGLIREGVAQGEGAVRTWHTWVEFWRSALRDEELRSEAHAVYRRWREILQDVITRGVANGRFSPDLDPALASGQVTALIDGIGIPLALSDPGMPAGSEAAAALVVDAVARLLRLRAGDAARHVAVSAEGGFSLPS
jgi:AcrR family transcriptional regulator